MKNRPFVPSLVATLIAVLSAALPIGAARAQCPHQTTKSVPMDVVFQGSQTCAGVKVQLRGVQFQTGNSCPLLAVYTPEHEIAEPTHYESKVVQTRTEAVLLISFVCNTDYFLFIPLGSDCRVGEIKNAGAVNRLMAVGC
jgi:hypothetical protein